MNGFGSLYCNNFRLDFTYVCVIDEGLVSGFDTDLAFG